MDIGFAVLTTASLGFIGLGTQPPTPDWGQMISEGREDTFEKPGGTAPFPDWRFCLPWSDSICSATGCATCSTRVRGENRKLGELR